MKLFYSAAIAVMAATPALAEGDPAAGEEAFNRQCVACHVVVDGNGETLAGRNARTGPNLYAVSGRLIGSLEDFRYSSSLASLGTEQEMTWDEASFVGYVQDPTGWLRETLDDRRARGRMAFQVRSEEDATNLYAYLASLAPAPDAEGEAETMDAEETETTEEPATN